MESSGKTAVIVGASSGIGAALARQLHTEGWRLGLMARREEKLAALAAELEDRVSTGFIDVSQGECVQRFEDMLVLLGGVDLVILSAGTGHVNPEREIALDQETTAVNVLGFMAIAEAAFRYFQQRGQGHLAGITSVAALRGSEDTTVYAASKAFQSVYLDGLRAAARHKQLSLFVTELQPGFVDTDMIRKGTSLPRLLHRLLVADVTTAARQMLRAISRKQKHAYITRRYVLVAWLLRRLPRP